MSNVSNNNEKKTFIYADYNGTTPPAPEVVKAVTHAMSEYWGNPNSDHDLGVCARMSVDKARDQVAAMIGGKSDEIIFTSGGTESNNMVLFGLCNNSLSDSHPHVITTNVEHVAVSGPLLHLQKSLKIEVTTISVNPYDSIVEDIFNAIKPNTVLVSVMAANNETGVLFPLKTIGQRLKKVNTDRHAIGLHSIVFHSDAAQIIGKEPFDVVKCQLDCVTIVGHKFYGPRIGALWSRVPIPPLLFGGGNQKRPGTDNTPMIVGLGVAASLVTANLRTYHENMLTAKTHLESKLKSLTTAIVKINCEELPRLVNTSSISVQTENGITGRELLALCDRLLASVGAACHSHDGSQVSQVLLNSGVPRLEADASIRISLGRDVTIHMVDEIIQQLESAIIKHNHSIPISQ